MKAWSSAPAGMNGEDDPADQPHPLCLGTYRFRSIVAQAERELGEKP